MFFTQFHEDLADVDADTFSMCSELVQGVDIDALNSTAEITNRYPAFYNILGYPLLFTYQNGIKVEPKNYKIVKVLENIKRLDIACLKDKTPYSVSVSIMKPESYIDWHYDAHTRSMVMERIHIPITTNELVSYYWKWFTDSDSYKIKLNPGKIYRFNNRVPHAVENPHSEYRFSILIDYVDKALLDYVRSIKRLDSWVLDELALIDSSDRSYNYVGETADVKCEAIKLFKYTDSWITQLGSVKPRIDPSRDAWASTDQTYINLLKPYN